MSGSFLSLARGHMSGKPVTVDDKNWGSRNTLFQLQDITVKFLNIRTLEKFAVIVLKVEQFGVMME